jgi:thiamine kinase-like enzyme
MANTRITEPTMKDLDEWLAELYDLSARMHSLIQLNNDMERLIPQCKAKDMMRGKLRAHVRRAHEELTSMFAEMSDRLKN